MPYTISSDIKIYYEVEGRGPPLVLGHGGGDSLEMWRKAGYAALLKDDLHLVMLDFRGHGRSSRAGSPEPHDTRPLDGPGVSKRGGRQSPPRTGMSADVLAVMNALGIEKAHYLGYSAGAVAGFDLAIHDAGRFLSFTLGGMTPYAWPDAMVKAVTISIDLYRLLLEEPERYLVRMRGMLGRVLTPEDREHFLNQDAEARIAGLTALLDSPALSDEELAGITTPSLVFCGDQDPFHAGALEAARHMPRVRFLSLPGLNHISALMRSDLVVPYVKRFIRDVTSGL